MKTYPKIETLFERDKTTFVVDPDRLKDRVLADISKYIVTEKVDGMNIRVAFQKGAEVLAIAGRSDNAQIPADLLAHINAALPKEKRDLLFREGTEGTLITLFGEGFGGSIQKGSAYGLEKRFILFDVLIEPADGGEFWLPEDGVSNFAEVLGIPRVPILGAMSLEEIVILVRGGFQSIVATSPKMAEGVVAKPRSVLFTSKGRVIIKLKTSDFYPGKR